jgi:hypothetical protein
MYILLTLLTYWCSYICFVKLEKHENRSKL